MPRVVAAQIALPEYVGSQAAVAEALRPWIQERVSDPRRILDILANAGVATRRSVLPVADVFLERTFEERNALYVEHGVDLTLEAARNVLAAAGAGPELVDVVTTVSCTGFMIPSVDAWLANQLPLRADVRRVPITELGCAAGAMGLGCTAELLTAYPQRCGLLTSVELSSVNFQPTDASMAHLVSCALFGDGAAGVLLAGDESPLAAGPGPRIVRSGTRFFHDTMGMMGFEVKDSGFHMVLDVRVPELLRQELGAAFAGFLGEDGRTLADIDHFLIHPGGRRILDDLEELLGRGPDAVALSRHVLREHGNLSSASVLFLLHEFLEADVARPGDVGLLAAFGPGFAAELVLLEWPC